MTDRVFIATPAYGGLVTTTYLESLLATKSRLEAGGTVVAVYTIRNESLIPRARNACVARFLAARRDGLPFTHLFFCDADIGFPPDALPRLLAARRPIVGGAYPLKSVEYATAAELARAGGPLGESADVLEAASHRYAIEATAVGELVDGFLPVDYLGTGFLLIERATLERLHANAALYQNDIAGYDAPALDHELGAPMEFRDLFATEIEPETRRYLSEDYAFCRRWRALGGEILCDVTLPLRHAGSHEHRGHVGYFLERLGVLTR